MKRIVMALALTLPVATFAASVPDGSFYKHATEGGLAEIDQATLAQSKSTNPKIKDFAAMMIKDHGAANDKLKGIADGKNITLPTSPSIMQMATKGKLDVLSGDTFDKSYIKGQIKAHQDTAALFKKEIQTGQDADAKAFAKATLPTITAHLKAIQAIAADTGATS